MHYFGKKQIAAELANMEENIVRFKVSRSF